MTSGEKGTVSCLFQNQAKTARVRASLCYQQCDTGNNYLTSLWLDFLWKNRYNNSLTS